jgi:hypothetical protein
MTSRDSAVRGRRPHSAVTAAAAAFALFTGVVGCAAAPGASGAAGRTPAANTPAANTAAANTAAANTPTGAKPGPAAAPAPPAALPVAPPSAATLPQTTARPRTDDAAFASAVHDIWLAVTTGNPSYALPAFFPEKAYEQVKAIADPAADWQGRLWSEFTLDLAAVHKLVKPGATLTGVTVPAQYAQWVPPGACYNSIGYWHVPGSRVVYREDGATRSFGIASFISWRGDWYLVHFGAVTRDGAYGIIDDPEPGPGAPGPPGGC